MRNLYSRIKKLEATAPHVGCTRVLINRHNVITAISRGFEQFIGNVFSNELRADIQPRRVVICHNKEK